MDKLNNITVGAGRIYLSLKGQDGERYLGDTPGFELAITSEKLDVYSSDTAVAEKLVSVVRNVERTATITCQDMSLENLALFLLGEVTSLTQTADKVTDEEATVKKGEWYQLGGGIGVRDVSAVSIQGAKVRANTYVNLVAGKDYTLDAKGGRVLMLVDAIKFGDPIKFTYTPKAATFGQVQTSDTKPVEGALRFRSDNTEGGNKDFYAPRAIIQPEGQIELKSRDNPVQITFNVEFLADASNKAIYFTNREAN